ncbi:hypothetical protein KDL29_02270 [bacterium]|nr:hypothetical protein [bacterium]
MNFMRGAVIDGRPAFAAKRDDVVYGYAKVDDPAGPTDWSIVSHGFSLQYGSYITVLEYGGLPQICCYSEDANELFLVGPAWLPARSGVQEWFASWLPVMDVEHGMANAMALQGGLPVVITSIEGAIPGELRYIRGY